MEPSPCYVLDGDDRWPGTVLAWRRDAVAGWVAVVRYTKVWPQGWPMGYEHAVPAARLEVRPA